MNYGAIKTRIRKLTGNKLASNQEMGQDEFYETIINDMVMPDFITRHDWFFKESMVTSQMPAGTYLLQMPSNLQNVGIFILHTGEIGTTAALTFMTHRRFFETISDPSLEAASFPSHYTWVNREIWLNCPTSAAWNIRMLGYTRFERLVADSDVPTWLDDDKHILLAYAGAGFIYQTAEDSKNAQVWFNIYEQGVESYWKATEHKRDDNAHLGKFQPDSDAPPGQYWANPFIVRSP